MYPGVRVNTDRISTKTTIHVLYKQGNLSFASLKLPEYIFHVHVLNIFSCCAILGMC